MGYRFRIVAGLFMVGVLLTGCSDGEDDVGETPSSRIGPLDPDEVSRLVAGRLTVAVEGDVEFHFEDAVELRVVTINEPAVSELRFFDVGIERFAPIEGGGAFRIAVDLVGAFNGPGSYEIPAAGKSGLAPVDPKNPDPNATASGLSKVFLTYNSGGDPSTDAASAAKTRSFENAVEPCDLQIGDAGESGELACPAVADATGAKVSIRMSWERADG